MTLDALIKRCNGSVTLEINPHRDVYLTVEAWLREQYLGPWHACSPTLDGMDPEQRDCDSLVVLTFYPDTPVGSYCVVAPTVGHALYLAERCLE